MTRPPQKTILTITAGFLTLVLISSTLLVVFRLREIGTQPVAPNVPQSQPLAVSIPRQGSGLCTLSFTVSAASCNEPCQTDNQCSSGLICDQTSQTCRRLDNLTSTTCQPPDTIGFACNSTCQTDTQCQSADPDFSCQDIGAGQKACRLAQNPTSTTCDPQTKTHLSCVNNSCQEVAGGGDNTCAQDQDCQPDAHLACVDQTCQVVEGSGTNSCLSDTQCTKTQRLACVDQACQLVEGSGLNTCLDNSDCAPTTSATHLTCVNNSCQQVAGSGVNSCSSDSDCQPVSTSDPQLPQAGIALPSLSLLGVGAILLIFGALTFLFL